MTAPIHHEPIDEPTRPATLVSRSKFESLATTLGSVVELTADAYYVTWNDRTYYTPRQVARSVTSPADQIAALDAWLTANPGRPSRPLTVGEQAVQDYWETVAEDRASDAAYATPRECDQAADYHYRNEVA